MTTRMIEAPTGNDLVKEEHVQTVITDMYPDGSLPDSVAAIHKDGLSIKEIIGIDDSYYEDDVCYSIFNQG